ncbi:hypothetical protein QC760_010611 [Botrytis cinerea]
MESKQSQIFIFPCDIKRSEFAPGAGSLMVTTNNAFVLLYKIESTGNFIPKMRLFEEVEENTLETLDWLGPKKIEYKWLQEPKPITKELTKSLQTAQKDEKETKIENYTICKHWSVTKKCKEGCKQANYEDTTKVNADNKLSFDSEDYKVEINGCSLKLWHINKTKERPTDDHGADDCNKKRSRHNDVSADDDGPERKVMRIVPGEAKRIPTIETLSVD